MKKKLKEQSEENFEKIKIYIRSKEKIYVLIRDEIIFYDNQSFIQVLENLREDYELTENTIVDIILHYNQLILNGQGLSEVSLKKRLFMKYTEEKICINHINDNYVSMFLEKKKIAEYRKETKKYNWKLNTINVDFCCLIDWYLKNEIESIMLETETETGELREIIENDENKEILLLGETESLRLEIEENKLKEIEKIDLKLDDFDNVNEFDFGDMEIIDLEENSIRKMFLYDGEFQSCNLLQKKELKFDFSNIGKLDIGIIILFGVLYYVMNSIIPLENEVLKNESIKNEIKKIEKQYLKEKSNEVQDYSEELKLLTEIDENMKRKEYYSFIKFLIDSSSYGIGYTKIKYENKKWNIQGEILDFEMFEKFENNIQKNYEISELGYIKDNETAVIFEYNIFENKDNENFAEGVKKE